VPEELRDVVRYVFYVMGCVKPFHVSRVLVLANWRAMERLGEPVARFTVRGFHAGFYVKEIPEIIDSDECLRRNKARRCVEYVCSKPEIRREYAEVIDEVIDMARELTELELNRLVIKDLRYGKLLKDGGF